MDKKLEFNEALSALIEYATVNGNEITTENVNTFFNDIIEDKSMMDIVYKYLLDKKIKITDLNEVSTKLPDVDFTSTVSEDSSEEFQTTNIDDTSSEEEQKFLDMYMNELGSIPIINESEKLALIEAVSSGNKDAFSKLTESYLPTVVNIADSFMGQGVRRGDLISEGNLGLIEAIANYDGATEFDGHIIKHIKLAMTNAINEEVGMHRIAEHAADRANAISDATTELAVKLGREATIEELCEYMALPEDEIRDIMKMSLDAMTINDKNIQ